MLSITRLSAAAISAKVVARTPVESGSLKASWTPGINEIVADNIDTRSETRRHDYAAVCNRLQAGDKYSLANGQDYARKIEYEGWSRYKAPQGMLRISVAEWDQIVRGVVRGI